MVSYSTQSWLERETLARYGLTFRSITEADQPFLQQLYASTRTEELAIVPWSKDAKEAFLELQFRAQHNFYQSQFKDANYWVIEQTGVPIGRLYLDQRADEIRIIDIALMPAYRDQGIGTALLNAVQALGHAKNQPVRINVEHNNRALNLYLHLGFTKLREEGIYYLMEWSVNEGR